MVQPRSQKYLYFALFLLPAFILYSVFFVYPFLNGFYVSLTNWDGLTPRSPISMEAGEFESRILGNIKKEADKDFILSIYEQTPDGSSWSRLNLTGSARRRTEAILSRSGYEPEKNRFVGFQNYIDILKGNVSETFYPRFFDQNFYTITSNLPSEIAKDELEKNFFPKCTPLDRSVFENYYLDNGETWKLNSAYSEFSFEDMIWTIPEIEKKELIPPDTVASFITALKKTSTDRNITAMNNQVDAFLSAWELSFSSQLAVKGGANGLYSLGEVKAILAGKWNARGFDLGVIGFTLFFAVFSVIGINLVAFILALALDTGIRGQKYLRSIFFLPNVLSMIIVALVWKMLFYQLFPRLTGINLWLSDPVKTPWLIVLVAIWQGAGYYMIVYLAGLQNIPTDVTEAAKIDGASSAQRFRHITLPLLVPAITISLFLTVANALKSFDLMYAMVGGAAYTLGTVPMVLDIFFDAFARKHAGLATAKAMLLFVVIFAVTGIQLYVMKKKEIEQ